MTARKAILRDLVVGPASSLDDKLGILWSLGFWVEIRGPSIEHGRQFRVSIAAEREDPSRVFDSLCVYGDSPKTALFDAMQRLADTMPDERRDGESTA